MFASGSVAAPLIMILTIGISLIGLFQNQKIIDKCLFRPYYLHRKGQWDTIILLSLIHI